MGSLSALKNGLALGVVARGLDRGHLVGELPLTGVMYGPVYGHGE